MIPNVVSLSDLPHDGFLIDDHSIISYDLLLTQAMLNQKIEFCRKSESQRRISWGLCPFALEAQPIINRGGPARQIYSRPFLIIVGTLGDVTVTEELTFHAVYLSNTLAMSSESHTRILYDTDYLRFRSNVNLQEEYNLILLGGKLLNKVTSLISSHPNYSPSVEEIFPQTEIDEKENGTFDLAFRVRGSECEYRNSREGLGAVFLSPLPPLPFATLSPSTSNSTFSLWRLNLSSIPSSPLTLVFSVVPPFSFRSLLALAQPTIPPMVFFF
jgi:hypothetical protein